MKKDLLSDLKTSLSSNNLSSYISLLSSTPLQLEILRNEYLFNILHQISDSNLPEKSLLIFVDKTLEQVNSLSSEVSIRDLLNSQTLNEERNSPLHLAIIRGKEKLAKHYLTLGADPTLQNNLGRSSLHLAAEAGTLGLFMMIQNLLHFDLNIEDKKGLTVLHLAIIQRHEEMALLIISLLPKLDFQEKSSSLALSIAVETGNYRIARHLMVNRSSKQMNLEEIKKKCLDKDIKKLLDRPDDGRRTKAFFLLFIFGIVMKEGLRLAFAGFFYQFSFKNLGIVEGSLQFGLFAVTLTFLIMANRKDPGFEVRDPHVTLGDLYSRYFPCYVCPYCHLKKHKETKHCVTCKKCVREYDHHCKWINNCVGKFNFHVFFAFLFVLLVDVLIDLGLCCFDVSRIGIYRVVRVDGKGFNNVFLLLAILVNLVILAFLIPVLVRQLKNLKHHFKTKKEKKVTLEYLEHIKSFKDMENEATSDTTSMVFKTSESNVVSSYSSLSHVEGFSRSGSFKSKN